MKLESGDMTLCKFSRINCPGMEIILISAVRLHSIKENVPEAWNQWYYNTHSSSERFFKVYHFIHTHLRQSCPITRGNFYGGGFLDTILVYSSYLFIVTWCCLCKFLFFHLVALLPCVQITSSSGRRQYV